MLEKELLLKLISWMYSSSKGTTFKDIIDGRADFHEITDDEKTLSKLNDIINETIQDSEKTNNIKISNKNQLYYALIARYNASNIDFKINWL